jgi:CHAT domain-containing protein
LVVFPNGSALDGQFYHNYRKEIKVKGMDNRSRLGLLYEHYFSPIARALAPRITRIYLSADGVYHLINLYTLWDADKKKYVLQEYAIDQLTVTSVLLDRARQTKKPDRRLAVLIGDPDFAHESKKEAQVSDLPVAYAGQTRGFYLDDSVRSTIKRMGLCALPWTKEEVSKIGQLLQSRHYRVEIYTGRQAQESSLYRIHGPAILHLATHGYFLSSRELARERHYARGAQRWSWKSQLDNPLLRSMLYFSGAKKTLDKGSNYSLNDGILTAYEAANLDLKGTQLVVLSACETGLGETMDGEGVYGMQRGFFMAGAKRVLMSLWQVDDWATQKLMQKFYALFLKNQDNQEALRQAQLQMLNNPSTSQPYFWGAFVWVSR